MPSWTEAHQEGDFGASLWVVWGPVLKLPKIKGSDGSESLWEGEKLTSQWVQWKNSMANLLEE